MKRKPIYFLLPFVLLLMLLFGSSTRSRAQAGDPYALIDAVNGLRAANGLPALEVNGILMAIAQGHTDYQAAIGQVTHTGAGGTRPRDRAAAAGYGGGGTFFISENIAGGTNLTIDEVISWWLGDDLHIQTMLGSNYREIGAGVAEADGFVYYTIDTASSSGGGSSSPPGGSSPIVSTPAGPTPLPVYLVQTAAPNPDGSVVHLVQPGQTLISIAIAYGVTVNEIKELNYLTGDVIYDGDKLTIRKAGTPAPTATSTVTKTPTRIASPTLKPTRTPNPSPSTEVTRSATPADSTMDEASIAGSDQLGSILVVAIIVLAVGGVLMMVVGSFIKPKSG